MKLKLRVKRNAREPNMNSTKFKLILLFAVAVARCGYSTEPAVPSPSGQAASGGVGPRIQFASTLFDFGKVAAGQQVRNDFVFTNTGDAVLEVTGVYPSCGCTTAGPWSRKVEPGKTGTIPLVFNSSRFNGGVTKTATVACNDKEHPQVMLQIKGTVWKPIDVNPQMAVLTVVPDAESNAPAMVTITSGLDEPITLSDPRVTNSAFAAELKTIKPGKEFELIIRAVAVPAGQGNPQTTIGIQTSSTNVPMIEVPVLAIVQPALIVMPQQITLPPGPLATPFSVSLTVRCNGVQPVTLSEPAINASGVELEIKDVAPGHQFAVTATFPAGFQVIPGERIELSIKSSDPKHPFIKVSVFQALLNSRQDIGLPMHHRGPQPPPPPPMAPAPAGAP
jgi:hypothetical protein